MKFLRALFSLWLVVGGSLLAQEEGPPEKPAPPPRQVRFLPVGDLPPFRQEVRDGVRYELEPPAGSIPPREVVLGFGDREEAAAAQAAPLLLGRITEPLRVPAGAGPLLVRRRSDAADSEPWLRVERPESGDFLVMLWRDPAKGNWDKVRALVLPEGPEAAPAGTVRIVNLATVTVGIVFAGEKIALPAGKSYQRAVAPGKQADFQLGAADAKGKLVRVHAGTVFQNPGERTLVVVYRADGVQPRRPLKALVRREPVPKAPPPVNPAP
jgi:hypothetical protein